MHARTARIAIVAMVAFVVGSAGAVAAYLALPNVVLHHVQIAEGVEVGAIELDKGLGLLWGDPEDITIRDAHLSATGIPTLLAAARRAGDGPAFRRLRIVDAVIAAPSGASLVAATATATATGLDFVVDARDPSPGGWTASGRGRITWDAAGHAVLSGGHVDVSIPAHAVGRATLTGTTVSADVTGDLSAPAVTATGTMTARSIAIGGLIAIDDARLPFTLTADGDGVAVAVSRGTATALGGAIASDPFAVARGKPGEVVIHATGLDLGRVLATLGGRRIRGTGVLDGELAIAAGANGWSLVRAGVRARDAGTIGVGDAGLRDRLAKLDSPFAVHQRITGALADFAYDELTAELGPRAADPELRVTLRGHGRRNAQELDLVLGVRGARDVLGPRLATSGKP